MTEAATFRHFPAFTANTADAIVADGHAPSMRFSKEANLAQGTVKWFNSGFGFIQPDHGNNDVFVNIAAVEAAGLRGLNEGQKVTFDIVTQRGKEAASNLKAAR